MATASASASVALFACSKCFSRHPFEELSQGQQLCKVNYREKKLETIRGHFQGINAISNMKIFDLS